MIDVDQFLEGIDRPIDDEALRWVVRWLEQNQDLLAARRILGQSEKDPTHRQIEALQKRLEDVDQRRKEYVERTWALLKIIDSGNELKHWDICPPSVPLQCKPPVSPFIPEARSIPEQIRSVDRWLARNNVETLFSSAHDRFELDSLRLGALIACASLRSGLLQFASIKALLQNLVQQKTYTANGISWVELGLEYRSQANAENRRWQPGLLTEAMLIGRDWSDNTALLELESRGWPIEKVWSHLNRFLVRSQLRRSCNVTSFTKWFNAVRYFWHINTLPIIADLARGRFVSHAVSPNAWARIQKVNPADLSLAGEEYDDEPAGLKDEETDEFDIPALAARSHILTLPWLKPVMTILHLKDRHSARTRLDKFAAASATAGTAKNLLPAWAAHLIRDGGRTGRKQTMSTIRKYMSVVGTRIAGLSGYENLLEIGTEGLVSIYMEVLDDARSPGHRKYMTRALRSFHTFLERKYDLAPVDESEVFPALFMRDSVDANLIALDEFFAIRAAIERDPGLITYGQAYVEAAWLVFTLGFRAGMRRMEVMGLRLCDIHIANDCEILVRPWASRRLKSMSATRKLPIHDLLDAQELTRLRKLVLHRRGNGANESDLLFEISDDNSASVTQSFLLPRLHEIMRHVTGDRTLRFHHLRHSFASWTLLRLLLCNQEFEASQWFPQHTETCRWLHSTTPFFRESLLKTAGPTRRSAYAVSVLMGHSCVRITLEHYFHFSDILIHNFAKRFVTDSAPEAIRGATHLSQASIYRHIKSEHSMLEALRRSPIKHGRLKELAAINVSSNTTKMSTLPSTGSGQSLAGVETYEQWRAFLIQASRRGGVATPELCRIHDLGQARGQFLVAQAEYLRNLSLVRQRGPRHKLMQINGIASLIPKAPRGDRELAFYSKIVPELLRLASSPHQRVDENSTVKDVICDWAHRTWSTQHRLDFRNDELHLAKSYLLLIRAIGLIDEEFEVIVFQEPRQRRQRQVNAALELPQRRPLVYIKPTNENSTVAKESVSIRVVHSDLNGDDRTVRCWKLALFITALIVDVAGLEHRNAA